MVNKYEIRISKLSIMENTGQENCGHVKLNAFSLVLLIAILLRLFTHIYG